RVTARATARQPRPAGAKDRLELAVTRNRRPSESVDHSDNGPSDRLRNRPKTQLFRARLESIERGLRDLQCHARRVELDAIARLRRDTHEIAHGSTLVRECAAEDAHM